MVLQILQPSVNIKKSLAVGLITVFISTAASAADLVISLEKSQTELTDVYNELVTLYEPQFSSAFKPVKGSPFLPIPPKSGNPFSDKRNLEKVQQEVLSRAKRNYGGVRFEDIVFIFPKLTRPTEYLQSENRFDLCVPRYFILNGFPVIEVESRVALDVFGHCGLGKSQDYRIMVNMPNEQIAEKLWSDFSGTASTIVYCRLSNISSPGFGGLVVPNLECDPERIEVYSGSNQSVLPVAILKGISSKYNDQLGRYDNWSAVLYPNEDQVRDFRDDGSVLEQAQMQPATSSSPTVSSSSGLLATPDGDITFEKNLSKTELRELQVRLGLLGYDPGGADGVFGRNTRSAVSSWQMANGFQANGYLNKAQVTRLRSSSEALYQKNKATINKGATGQQRVKVGSVYYKNKDGHKYRCKLLSFGEWCSLVR